MIFWHILHIRIYKLKAVNFSYQSLSKYLYQISGHLSNILKFKIVFLKDCIFSVEYFLLSGTGLSIFTMLPFDLKAIRHS